MAGSYNAGIVTAYGAALRGGYTGTYEQFCAQQANYAQTAAAVEQAKTDAQAAAQRAQDVADSIPADYSQMSEDVSQLKEDFYDSLVTDTASGEIASFSDGADNVPVKSLTVAIEPVQSGSGDPSPSNIRPISGWTQAKVTRTGVNLWDEEWKVVGSHIASKNPIPCLPNTTYYMSSPAGPSNGLKFWTKDMVRTGSTWYNAGQFTTPADCYYMTFEITDSYGTTYNHDISINYPSTDTDYHSGADNETYTIDLNGTIYGGTLDVTTGVLTVDRAYYTTTLSTKDNVATGTYDQYIFYSRWTGGYISTEVDADASIRPICNIAPYLYSNAQTSTHFYVTSTGFQVFVPSGTAETTAVEIAYFLKEPFEVTLTAQEVRTLLAQNNVFADCGDTTVEYRADTKLYIQKVLNA